MSTDVESSLPKTAIIIGTATVIFSIYLILKAIHNAFFGPLSKFPGPTIRAFTIIPHAWAIAKGDQHTDLVKLHAKYGPIVRFGPHHVMFAGNHQAWKDIYGFKKHGVIPKDPVFYGMTVNGAHSVATTADADNHARQRKIFSNAFSDRALRAQEPLIKTWSTKLAKKLRERADTGIKTDMLKYYNCATFDIMGDLTFGESLNMLEDSEYIPWVKAIFDGVKGATILRAFKYLGSWPSYFVDDVLFKMQAVRSRVLEHWNFSASRVDARLAKKSTRPDIWTLVEQHGGLSLEEHHSNGNVFIIAGSETTATALSGTTYHLLRNPEVLKKLTTEIRSAITSPDDLHLENLAQLKYLQAVLQEGLRMYPPAPIDLPREVAKGGTTVAGHFLPAGTKVGISQFASFHMEENFRDPHEFHPERWLGDVKYKDDNLGAVEPFSIGPRNCLGKNLAWHEMRILLATVLFEFDLELQEESLDWTKQKVYTLWEKKPLWVTLSRTL